MPNPFPGVDPYIEAANLWPGFHNLLIGDISRLLNRVLKPRGYAAFPEERLELVDLPDADEDRRPDVGVARAPWSPRPDAPAMGGAALIDVETAVLELPRYELLTMAFIEIRHLPGHKLVTSIELLSPSNKGKSRGGYAAKRRSVLATDAHLIEIDLLLGGQRPEMVGPDPAGDFRVLISRAERRPVCEAYDWSIRRALPRIPVPLLWGDADAVLDLAAAYAMSYEDGPYDLAAMHKNALAGPLSDADREWVAELLAARTGRTQRGA